MAGITPSTEPYALLFARKIKDGSWENYQHEYGSAGGTQTSIDLDTDLMRLAAGGSTG